MALPLYLVDAFTDRPFAGNPAGVCLLTAPLPDDVMQNVAMEMHQAETAFLLPEGDGWRLRWFTPEVEENLCGHATLASAHVLFETGLLAPGATARFQTKSGLLTAAREAESIVLDFPATPAEEAHPASELALKALSISPVFSGKTRFDLFFEVATEAEVRALAPDFAALEAGPLPRRHRHRPRRRGDAERLRLPLLRTRLRRPRGPGHRVGPLRARALLAGEAREGRPRRLPGFPARRDGPGRLPRRAGPPRGNGRHRRAGRARPPGLSLPTSRSGGAGGRSRRRSRRRPPSRSRRASG